MISVSIISHGHGSMVCELTRELLRLADVSEIIITLNKKEEINLPKSKKIKVIKNKIAKGFGANHNSAFMQSHGDYFAPLNPDIKIIQDPFPELLKTIKKHQADIAAPLALNSEGKAEDNFRKFPTAGSILLKILTSDDGSYKTKPGDPVFTPDWAGGMFLIFKKEAFKTLNGFDEKYFLYYEDVDICLRAKNKNLKLIACPKITVIHNAQRDSRRNLKHLSLHIKSLIRYLIN